MSTVVVQLQQLTDEKKGKTHQKRTKLKKKREEIWEKETKNWTKIEKKTEKRNNVRPSLAEGFWKPKKKIRNSFLWAFTCFTPEVEPNWARASKVLAIVWWEVSRPVLLFSRGIGRTFDRVAAFGEKNQQEISSYISRFHPKMGPCFSNNQETGVCRQFSKRRPEEMASGVGCLARNVFVGHRRVAYSALPQLPVRSLEPVFYSLVYQCHYRHD